MRKRLLGAATLLAFLGSMTVFAALASARPVTVTITRATNLSTDLEDPLRFGADFYAGVKINGVQLDSFASAGSNNDNLTPFWVFTVDVPDDQATVPIEMQLWDNDECSHPFCHDTGIFQSDDDQADINPSPGSMNVNLLYDTGTGTWSGDTPNSCSTGDDPAFKSTLCWDISGASTSGDADGDGLLDGWEQRGYDADGDGIVDIPLNLMGANPLHKDLFLEMDVMSGNKVPTRAGLQQIRTAFANAPLSNPDGTNGVTIHFDLGNVVDPSLREDGAGAGSCTDGIDNGGGDGADGADPDCIAGDNMGGSGGGSVIPAFTTCGTDSAFYNNKLNNFNPNRLWIFRYCVIGKQAAGCTVSGGQGEIGGNDFIEFNGGSAGTIMHELGHTLNLRHGGIDNTNCKPNYVSVMNYDLQFGIPQTGGGTILDYSPPRFPGGRGIAPYPTLNESSLTDNTILDATDSQNLFTFVNSLGAKIQSRLNNKVDWNADGDFLDAGQSINVDTSGLNGRPTGCTNGSNNDTMVGFNDWANISIPFRQFGDSASGAINPTNETDPTEQEMNDLFNEINTTDLQVTATDTPDPVAAGATFVMTLTVTNRGANPAQRPHLVLQLPSDVTFGGSDVLGASQTAGTVTWDLAPIDAGKSAVVHVTVNVPANLVFTHGGPVTLNETASIDNRNCPAQFGSVCPDGQLSNNTAAESTKVIAKSDLKLVGFAAQTPPTQLLIGQSANVSVPLSLTNLGPSAPIDVKVSATATASAGATVSPASTVTTAGAVGLNEARSLSGSYTMSCSDPGFHTFTFTVDLAPLHPEDVDPNLANNHGNVAVTVDCVVPVALNVKPGSFPNPININPGAVPLAVLTTHAGEYGLPLAFDATKIDPLTVKFGAVSAVWAGTGGAVEFHGKGHPEKSVELNETTVDADVDMVLHFRADETGLTVGMTQAAIKGEYVAPNGVRYRFFGTDSVQVKP